MHRARTARLALLVIAVVGATLAFAPLGSAQPKGGDPAADIEANMKKANRAFKTLAEQVGDPAKNAASLELLQTIETSFIAAKVLVPAKAKKIPEAKRAEFVRGFRTELIKAITAFLDLEKQLLAGENAKAKETVERIKALQKEGHDLYQDEE